MSAETRRATERLRRCEPDTASGLIMTEFVSESAATSVEEALRKVRVIARSGRREALHAIYITNSEGRLAGVLSPK
jgi:Mg/Co/Ni transporter MgtE